MSDKKINSVKDVMNNKLLQARMQLKPLKLLIAAAEDILDIYYLARDSWSAQSIQIINNVENKLTCDRLWTAAENAKDILKENVKQGDKYEHFENSIRNVITTLVNMPEEADPDITFNYMTNKILERKNKK